PSASTAAAPTAPAIFPGGWSCLSWTATASAASTPSSTSSAYSRSSGCRPSYSPPAQQTRKLQGSLGSVGGGSVVVGGGSVGSVGSCVVVGGSSTGVVSGVVSGVVGVDSGRLRSPQSPDPPVLRPGLRLSDRVSGA